MERERERGKGLGVWTLERDVRVSVREREREPKVAKFVGVVVEYWAVGYLRTVAKAKLG